ncbi:MAG TPA: hypothetical protein VLA48_03020 [Nitrososphaeraceae archaeon]|nr:hypothetical protein [Nitrososphaeraceae archaeon]
MRLRELYQDLLRTGDLFEMYSDMVGDFEQDKIKFKTQQEALESFSNNLDVEIDD